MISTGWHLTILESVDSTNNYAMARVRTGLAKHGDGYFAMQQTGGKGQRGKTWVTERGSNIIISLLMQPVTLQLHDQFQFSAAVALAVHDFFTRYTGDEVSIKWPNDLYWRDRKAGGILIENIVGTREWLDVSQEPAPGRPTPGPGVNNQASAVDSEELALKNRGNIAGSRELLVVSQELAPGLPTTDSQLTTNWAWAIVGIGININQTAFPGHIRNAVSLKQITGKDRDVVELAKELCSYVQTRYEELLAGNNLLQQYNNRLYKKGQPVKFKKGSRVFEGIVKEVNRAGQLVLVTDAEECFSLGEIEWIF